MKKKIPRARDASRLEPTAIPAAISVGVGRVVVEVDTSRLMVVVGGDGGGRGRWCVLKVVMVVALVTATVTVGCSHGDDGDEL